MTFQQILNDIKELKIQGAINIAQAGLKALHLQCKEKGLTDVDNYIEQIKATRPTEPAMRNIINLYKNKTNPDNLEDIYQKLVTLLQEEKVKITKLGLSIIENGMNIFTHCHSSTVIDILLEAKKQGKVFEVYNTEVRPRWQGHSTVKDLLLAGIPVHHTIDNAAHYFIPQCDLFIFGADAVDSLGYIYNKIGTLPYCEIANKHGIKTLSATELLKYDIETKYGKPEEIEIRDHHEVWDIEKETWYKKDMPLSIYNPAFDSIPKELINGLITSTGILSIDEFIQDAENLLK